MKTPIPILFLFFTLNVHAQVTNPAVNAFFGVDAELRANILSKDMQFSDDWFSDGTGNGVKGAGTFIIDTTGAAAITARYATDPAFRKLPFYRTMRFPSYSVVNNRMMIDGVFIRDYHGDDSTVFGSGSNKNGQSPAVWTTPVSQSVPNKNDIKDMFVHLRRSGPDPSYDLWLTTGVCLISPNGDRYFDFEMYQTDIFYERASQKFYNYGPNEGHTAWTFDAAGNIAKPGDVIFTSEFSNASLNKVEARIWVHKSALTIKPTAFNWGGAFDGDGGEYGYANILPKTPGDFYTGIQNKTATWAGPFKFIDGNNIVQSDYAGGQFMEFAVNLTKLGLDPVTMLGGSACGLPFRRVLAKSRSSSSFSSELKDFVGPFDFFLTPKVKAVAEMPILCSTNGISKISVTNPYETSIYTWSTPDGIISGRSDTTFIYANKPGTYIVQQQLMDGCGAYATDTVTIVYDPFCVVLSAKEIRLSGALKDGKPSLNWTSEINEKTRIYEVQRSTDGQPFQTIDSLENLRQDAVFRKYAYQDGTVPAHAQVVSYRIKAIMHSSELISSALPLQLPRPVKLSLYPNPANKELHISLLSEAGYETRVSIVNMAGKLVYEQTFSVKPGKNMFTLNNVHSWAPGLYMVRLSSVYGTQWQKLLIQNHGPLN